MEPIGNSAALLCQGKVNTEDIADNASDLNYWRHIATQDFAAMLAAKENSTHTQAHTQNRRIQHTVQKDGRNFNFFWQTISGRFNQFQLKNLIVPAMNAPTEDAQEGAAAFLGAEQDDKADNCLSSLSSGKSRVEAGRVGVTATEATGAAAAGAGAAECSASLGSKASIQCWLQPVIVP